MKKNNRDMQDSEVKDFEDNSEGNNEFDSYDASSSEKTNFVEESANIGPDSNDDLSDNDTGGKSKKGGVNKKMIGIVASVVALGAVGYMAMPMFMGTETQVDSNVEQQETFNKAASEAKSPDEFSMENGVNAASSEMSASAPQDMSSMNGELGGLGANEGEIPNTSASAPNINQNATPTLGTNEVPAATTNDLNKPNAIKSNEQIIGNELNAQQPVTTQQPTSNTQITPTVPTTPPVTQPTTVSADESPDHYAAEIKAAEARLAELKAQKQEAIKQEAVAKREAAKKAEIEKIKADVIGDRSLEDVIAEQALIIKQLQARAGLSNNSYKSSVKDDEPRRKAQPTQAKKAAPQVKREVKQNVTPKSKTTYRVKGLTEGQVWVEVGNDTRPFAIGQSLPNGDKITAIDASKGIVKTQKGSLTN